MFDHSFPVCALKIVFYNIDRIAIQSLYIHEIFEHFQCFLGSLCLCIGSTLRSDCCDYDDGGGDDHNDKKVVVMMGLFGGPKFEANVRRLEPSATRPHDSI